MPLGKKKIALELVTSVLFILFGQIFCGHLTLGDYGAKTAYPVGIALAASWDADLARRVGISMGKDARARGVHFVLAPGMNIYGDEGARPYHA